jgi:hypothetical protein
VVLTAIDAAAGEQNHRAPWFLPDGQHFLYTARNADTTKTRVYVESIDAKPGSRTRREVLTNGMVRRRNIYSGTHHRES